MTDIEERIRVRAYYAWLNHYRNGVVNAVLPGNDKGYWKWAELQEQQRAAKRSAAAKKAAATRKGTR